MGKAALVAVLPWCCAQARWPGARRSGTLAVMGDITMPIERDQRNGRFLAGNSGNGGRKPGSRNKLAESFVADLKEIWEEHGITALERVAQVSQSGSVYSLDAATGCVHWFFQAAAPVRAAVTRRGIGAGPFRLLRCRRFAPRFRRGANGRTPTR